jgi:hypothetical protein
MLLASDIRNILRVRRVLPSHRRLWAHARASGYSATEGSHNGIAAVLKTADRKVFRVRISGLPLSQNYFSAESARGSADF